MNEEKTASGKRAKPGLPATVKIAVAAAVLLAALFCAYAALCAWAGDQLPAGVQVELQPGGQTVSLGGLTLEEARELLEQSIQSSQTRAVTVHCGGETVVLDAGCFEPDPEAIELALDEVEDLISGGAFLTRGVRYLAQRMGGGAQATLELPCTYRYSSETDVEQRLAELAGLVSSDPTDPACEIGNGDITVTTGMPGAALDVEQAKASVLEAYNAGRKDLYLLPGQVEPAAVDLEALNGQVLVEPQPVGADANGRATPPVVGVSIDLEAAQALLDAAAPGETVTIPLVYTQPDYTQAGADGLLYQDLLSECVTSIGGTAGRVGNVTLAAEKCNGVVLLPGDIFDYNQVVGQRTAAGGYSAAPAYVNGLTVESIGGGICQVSSSLYYCMVYANLEAVSRINHRYAVGYVPDGLDATVSWGGPEFRFKNNSDYPIKIVAYVSGRTLTVQFYGTNPDGIYVTTERSTVSTSSYTTVYQPDESVPRGTTQVEVTPYSGRKVIVYRCVYAADGTLISRSLENTSDYKSRDEVILYNPADAASLGLITEPEPPVEPEPPTEPEPPVESEPPTESEPPVESEPPTESEQPVETQPPAETEPPEGGIPLD